MVSSTALAACSRAGHQHRVADLFQGPSGLVGRADDPAVADLVAGQLPGSYGWYGAVLVGDDRDGGAGLRAASGWMDHR